MAFRLFIGTTSLLYGWIPERHLIPYRNALGDYDLIATSPADFDDTLLELSSVPYVRYV
jgi:hypothetical protein